MPTYKEIIIEKAKKLIELDRECLELSYERKTPRTADEQWDYLLELFNVCCRAFDSWNVIKLALPEIQNVGIYDAGLEEVVRKVRNDDELYCIRQYKRLVQVFNRDLLDDKDKLQEETFDFVFDQVQSWELVIQDYVDDVSYFARRAKVGTVISRRKISDTAVKYFNEIRESFAFGLFRSAIALCRALLEIAFFETLKRHGLGASQEGKLVSLDIMRDNTLAPIILEAHNLGIIDGKIKQISLDVNRKVNTMILHSKDVQQEINEMRAIEIIRDTVRVVEYLHV